MSKYVVFGGLIGLVYTFLGNDSRIAAIFLGNPISWIIYAYFALPVWGLRVRIGYSRDFADIIVYVSFVIVGMIIGLVVYKIKNRIKKKI